MHPECEICYLAQISLLKDAPLCETQVLIVSYQIGCIKKMKKNVDIFTLKEQNQDISDILNTCIFEMNALVCNTEVDISGHEEDQG